MTPDPAWFRAAVSSGDADRVNEALSALRRSWPVERPALLGECVPACQECYESGDGYQRQSAVRFLRGLLDATEGLSRSELDARGSEGPFPAVEETLLAAVRDDDGRVRRSAVAALRSLAAAYDRRGSDRALEDLNGLLATFEAVADSQSVADAVAQARAAVADESDSSLPADRLVCPRCRATLARWSLDGRTTVDCENCGYAGVATDVSGTPTSTESWADALDRFHDQHAGE